MTRSRYQKRWLTCLAAASLAFTGPAISPSNTAALADDPPATIVRVEEDWELIVGTPDLNSVAPQVTSVFSPTSDLNGKFAAFEINHKSQPSFSGGGLQIQVWQGEYPCCSQASPHHAVMSTSGETVRWTQAMTIANGHLVFQVLNGTSTTWGGFGTGNLQVVTNTSLPNLNGYSPDLSADSSGAGYAANRVQSLVLKRVRLITDTGEVLEDNTLRSAYPRD